MLPDQLSRKHNLLEILFDRVPMAIAVLNQDLTLRSFNPAWLELGNDHGFFSPQDLKIGVKLDEISPFFMEQFEELLNQARHGELVQLKSLKIQIAGRVSYWDGILAPLKEEQDILGILIMLSDETQRIKAQQDLETTLQMLEENETRLNLVINATNDGVWDWDLETDTVYYSPRWKAMLGYKPGELQDHLDSWKEIVHPEDLQPSMEAINDFILGKSSSLSYEQRMLHRNGTYRWFLCRGTAVRDENGKVCRLVGTDSDITLRKTTEEALKESEANLRSLLEKATNFAIYRIRYSPDNLNNAEVVMVSPSLKEITGITELYNFDNWFKNIHPQDLPRVVEANQRAWLQKEPYNEEVRFYNPQKQKWVWVHTASSPIFDIDGKITHFNGLVIDITKQKEAEEALRYQAKFEKIITSISTNFINLRADQIDDGINEALQIIGKFAKVDRSYVFLFSDDGTTLTNTHEWCEKGINPQIDFLKDIPVQDLHWSNTRFLNGETLYLQDLEDLPPTAQAERELFISQGTKSLVAVPMSFQGKVIGFLGFDSVKHKTKWSKESITLLQMIGEMFVNALELKKAQAVQDGQQRFLELLATEGTFSETLEALIRIIEEQSPGMLGLILLLDEDGETLHIGASISLPKDYLDEIEGLKTGPMVGSCGTAAYSGKRVIVTDIQTDPRWVGLRNLAVQYGLRACWSEPVFSSDHRVIGTFAMYYTYPRTPTPSELRIIEVAAHLAGVAIQQKRAQDELRLTNITLESRVEERTREIERRQRVAEGLRDILGCINSNQTLDEVLDFIVQQANQLLETSVVSLYLLQNPAGPLKLKASRGLNIPSMVNYEIELGEGATGMAVLKRQPVYFSEATMAAIKNAGIYIKPQNMDTLQQLGEQFKASLAVPMIARDQVYGALTMYYPNVHEFSEEEIGLVVAFADQAALAIQNARLTQIEQERKSELENLYRQSQRRADETQTLFSVQQAITSRLDPDVVLQMIADEARRLTETSMSAVYLLEEENLVISVISGEVDQKILGYKLPLDNSVAGLALRTGKSYLVGDAIQNPKSLKDLVNKVGVKSFLVVPLMSGNGPIGTIMVANKNTGNLDEEDRHVLTMLASGAVIAIENARYYQSEQDRRIESERRRKVAEGLGKILTLLNTNRSIQEVLDFIALQAGELMKANATMLERVDLKNNLVSIISSNNLASEFDTLKNTPFPLESDQATQISKQPLILLDLHKELHRSDPSHPLFDNKRREVAARYFKSSLSVPLTLENQDFGCLTFFFENQQNFEEEDIRLAASISDQASLAIQNAHLRSQAEKSAATAERNRLARDLHDAVTQTLFSASLIAEVLPRLWDKKPEEGRRRLEELRQLTRGALAEMRTLLMELRPTALMEAEIDELFHQLTDAFVGRTRIPVSVNIVRECELQPEVRIAMYRIAQESLNNIAKHAKATQVNVLLDCSSEKIILSIQDNGRGFNPENIPQDHLGVSIMKERAESIGAQLTIKSKIQEGTKITAVWTK